MHRGHACACACVCMRVHTSWGDYSVYSERSMGSECLQQVELVLLSVLNEGEMTEVTE